VKNLKDYMKERQALHRQYLATTDPLSRAEIDSRIINIDHEMKAIRRGIGSEELNDHLNDYMKEREELSHQFHATTDPLSRAEIDSRIINIDHEMKTIRHDLFTEVRKEGPQAAYFGNEGEELLKSGKWSPGGKVAAGIAAVTAVAAGSWALYEHNRSMEKSSEQSSSPSR
jgi:hypothetical protein